MTLFTTKFTKKEEENLSPVFTSSIKREISKFHVVVVQRWQRNGPKSVMHVQSCCFAVLNLRPFCNSRCFCRRRFLEPVYMKVGDPR